MKTLILTLCLVLCFTSVSYGQSPTSPLPGDPTTEPARIEIKINDRGEWKVGNRIVHEPTRENRLPDVVPEPKQDKERKPPPDRVEPKPPRDPGEKPPREPKPPRDPGEKPPREPKQPSERGRRDYP